MIKPKIKCEACGENAQYNEEYDCEQYAVMLEDVGMRPRQYLICENCYFKIERILNFKKRI